MKRIFELDAAAADADLGIGLLWKGLEVTAIDGTTMELARNEVLEGESGVPAERARPVLRVTAHARTATFLMVVRRERPQHHVLAAFMASAPDPARTLRAQAPGDARHCRIEDVAGLQPMRT